MGGENLKKTLKIRIFKLALCIGLLSAVITDIDIRPWNNPKFNSLIS